MLDLFNRVYIAAWTRLRRQEGQTLVEYAIIAGLVVAGVVGTMYAIGVNVGDLLGKLGGNLNNPSGA